MSHNRSLRGMCSTRLAFVLSASGPVVGLGNPWRPRFAAGGHEGGAFVITGPFRVAAIAIAIMMALVPLDSRDLSKAPGPV